MSHSIHLSHRSSRRLGRPGILDLMAIYRQRKALSRLDSTRLDDLGLSAEQARKEADRPVWDVPDHWLR